MIVIQLVGPGGAGKSTTGAALARRLSIPFVDLDERFSDAFGNISEFIDAHGYDAYAARNVGLYPGAITAAGCNGVLALSSGFMTYSDDIHPDYRRYRREIASSRSTFVLLPSLEIETCAAEIVRRQLSRPFSRSAEREDEVIRARFSVYRNLPATKVETARPVDAIVTVIAAQLVAQLP